MTIAENGPKPGDDQLRPISALNHLLFCPRRCALIHVERVWVENVFTLEGSQSHKKVHASPSDEEISGAERIVRGLLLRSDRLRLVGVADLVEFRKPPHPGPLPRSAGEGGTSKPPHPGALPRSGGEGESGPTPYPVEYKRGRRRKWDNDEVQLCAQALCLEEMLGAAIPAGAIFHIKTKRRREILFDAALRQRTEDAVARLHALLDSGITPEPIPHPKCAGCSVRAQCLPDLVARSDAYRRAERSLFVLAE